MSGRKQSEIYVARESFHSDEFGLVVKGERVRRGHKLLDKHAGYFEAVDEQVRYDVEQATSAPGEKRVR